MKSLSGKDFSEGLKRIYKTTGAANKTKPFVLPDFIPPSQTGRQPQALVMKQCKYKRQEGLQRYCSEFLERPRKQLMNCLGYMLSDVFSQP